MSKNREFLTQLRRDIGSDSVLQKGPGAVQDALGVGKNDLLVLARAKRDLGGEDIGIFGVEEALFPQDAQEVQKLLRVVGTVRIAEARVLVAVAVAVGVRDRVSVVEMRDIRPERTDDKAGVLVRDGNVAEVDDEAEVLVPRAHIGGKARSQGSRTDERGLIDVVVKHLELHTEPFFRRVIAKRVRGLYKLRVRLLLRRLVPVTGEEVDYKHRQHSMQLATQE